MFRRRARPAPAPQKPSLMSRLRPRRHPPRSHHTATTTSTPVHRGRFSRRVRAEPVHHQHRKPSIGDKISGAMLKLKGTIERKPGKKAAGTRRMHGTDGRRRRRYY